MEEGREGKGPSRGIHRVEEINEGESKNTGFKNIVSGKQSDVKSGLSEYTRSPNTPTSHSHTHLPSFISLVNMHTQHKELSTSTVKKRSNFGL